MKMKKAILLLTICLGVLCGCSSAGDEDISVIIETLEISASEAYLIDFDAYFNGVEIDEDSDISINGSYFMKTEDVRSLRLRDATISSLDFVQNYESLKNIEIVDCAISENCILPKMKSLESITIGICDSDNIDLGHLKSLDIIQNNNQIKRLHCVYFDVESVSVLSSFSELTELDLWGNKASTPLDLEPLSNLTNLQRISLIDGSWNLESIKPLYDLPNLECIEMSIVTFRNLPKDETDYFEDIIEID